MRITKIHLQNIGVFEDTTIVFPKKTDPNKAEIHILTGENGTGKSTVLYALAAPFMEFSSNEEYNLNIYNRFRFYDLSSNLIVYADDEKLFELNGENKANVNVYGTYHRSILSEYTQALHELNWHPRLIAQRKFSLAAFAYSGSRVLEKHHLASIEEITVSPFKNAVSFNKTVDSTLITKWLANTITKESLELRKNNNEKAARYRLAISRIEQAVSLIIDEQIALELESDPLDVVVQFGDKLLNFDLLPDGLKSIISWIADLLMRLDRIRWIDNTEVFDKSFFLFLDEIDIHLHPAWQRKVLPAIQKLFKNAQIFVSTHSPFVVGSVDGACVHKLVLNEKGNSQAEPARRSEDGESYQFILKEIFDVEEQFGVGTEEMLFEFRKTKSKILQDQNYDKERFLKLAHDIAVQSVELRSIIGMELRQLSRIKQVDFSV